MLTNARACAEWCSTHLEHEVWRDVDHDIVRISVILLKLLGHALLGGGAPGNRLKENPSELHTCSICLLSLLSYLQIGASREERALEATVVISQGSNTNVPVCRTLPSPAVL